MFALSGYILILIGLIAIYEQQNISLKHYIFIGFVFISSILAEYVGVSSGILFGDYSYNVNFEPSVFGVPLAIGFAWISTFFGANQFSNKFKNILVYSLLVGTIMTLFDYLMEPAAINLNYWVWDSVNVPLKNYLTWFGLSFIFAFISKVFKLEFKSKNLTHLMYAQALYFIMSY